MASTWYVKQGDLLPPLTGRFVDAVTGVPQTLAGATLKFHMQNADGDVLIDADAAVVGDQDDPEFTGRFRYDWVAGETGPFSPDGGPLQPGERAIEMEFEGEIEATFGSKPLTAPNKRNFRVVMFPEIA